MLNLPNSLTLIRILTIPFFLVYLAYHRYSEALIVFIIGGVTDFLDGLAARLMNQQTALGAYLDPVADKLLVFTSFVMLGLIDGIPMWLAVVVVSRDALIILGYAVIYVLVEERIPAKPSYIGKCSTFLQLTTLGVALLLLHDARLLDALVLDILVAATTVATVVSGFQYVYRGLMWLQSRAPSITRIG
ncbi:MAG: CDP-alcohol phosphatidyltransferase family protein [Deltaproteobacteria bacterium]|nr:CDP-alcohol phosphatidyltransferase family protein [Deltaproteobacteria bacterium]MDZ4346009.1 CDP-alcohol phosphatidyltransferase family protein [Candidatus Binatia bacterium]